MSEPKRIWRAWEDFEINLIKELYPTGGSKACIKHLPHRTESAIKAKAGKVGAKMVSLKTVKKREKHREAVPGPRRSEMSDMQRFAICSPWRAN